MTRSQVAELLERLVRIVPGIGGYQDREKCRATDKAVREQAAANVARCRDRFSRLMADLARTGGAINLRMIGDMERVVARAERLEDEIRYASYGFTGWFDPSGVVLEDLERVYLHDLELLEKTGSLADCVPEDSAGDSTWVRELAGAIDQTKSIVEERARVLQGR